MMKVKSTAVAEPLDSFERLQKPLDAIQDHLPGAISQFGETKSLYDIGSNREKLADGTDIDVLGKVFRKAAPSCFIVKRSTDEVLFLVPEDKFELMRDAREVQRIETAAGQLAQSLNAAWVRGDLPRHLLK